MTIVTAPSRSMRTNPCAFSDKYTREPRGIDIAATEHDADMLATHELLFAQQGGTVHLYFGSKADPYGEVQRHVWAEISSERD